MTSLALAGLLFFQLIPHAAPPTRTFTDPNLRVTFNYPVGFQPKQNPEDAAEPKPGPDGFPAIPCITTPLFAIRHVAPHQDELMLLIKLDFGCMGRQVGPDILPGIATNTLKQGLTRIGKPVVAAPVHYSLGKFDSYLVQASAPDPTDGIPGHAAAVCTLDVNTVLCWEVLTAYPSHLAPLLASTVAFGKADPTPIVPAALIVTPPGDDPDPATRIR